MEIEFIFSEIYHKQLNKHSVMKGNWEKVKDQGEKFVAEYFPQMSKLVQEIENVGNFKFKDQKIKVYVVGWDGPSFSEPVTLNARKEIDLMFATLAHELGHKLFPGSKSSLELEEKVNDIAEKVLKNLNIKDFTPHIELMRKFARTKYNNEKPNA